MLVLYSAILINFKLQLLLKKENSWPRRASANLSKRLAGFSTMWMSFWSAF